MVLSFYINTYEATQWDILLFVVSNTDLLKTGKLKNVSTRPGLPYLEIPFFSVFSDVNFITIRIQFRHSLDEFTY